MWWLTFLTVNHVPQYDCAHGCCHAKHTHTTSQVAYLKNAGGIEVEFEDIEIGGAGEIVDFDFVFKKQYDMTTFSLHVGCGGCASSKPDHYEAPLTLPIALPEYYQNGKLEGFTQTSYFPLFPEGKSRQFNTTRLQNCSSHHFSLRLVKHDNATEDIVWGAVLGCPEFECERFTIAEQIAFPIFVIRNHGTTWNDAAWTLPFYAVMVAALMAFVLWWWWGGWLAFKVPHGPSFPRQIATMENGSASHWANLKCVVWRDSARCVLYAIAVWAILVDVSETLHHYYFIASPSAAQDETGLSIFTIWVSFKLFFFLAAMLPWVWIREIPATQWRKHKFRCACDDWYDGLSLYSPLWACGQWAFLDLAIGCVAFFFFGAGFFVYPLAIVIAAIFRLLDWYSYDDIVADPACEIYIANDQLDTGCAIQQELPSLNLLHTS